MSERRTRAESDRVIKAQRDVKNTLKTYGLEDGPDPVIKDTKTNIKSAADDAAKDFKDVFGPSVAKDAISRSRVFQQAAVEHIPRIPVMKPGTQQALFTAQHKFQVSGGRDEKARASVGSMMANGTIDWSNTKHPITQLACQTPKCPNSVDVLDGGVVCNDCENSGKFENRG